MRHPPALTLTSATYTDRHGDRRRLSISQGTTKMGAIASVSHSPVLSCARSVDHLPCAASCYDRRLLLIRPTVARARAANLAALDADLDSYLGAVDAWLTRYAPPRWRWHVGGDVVSADHVRGIYDVTRRHRGTRALMFTKAHGLVSATPRRPRNLSVVYSMWPGWADPASVPGPRAWTLPDPRAPHDVALCPGSCATCHLCWHLARHRVDVGFGLRP